MVITPVFFEALMLLCFGVAWPVATYRMLRSGRAEGKGLLFTSIIGAGYVFGAMAKVLAAQCDGAALAPIFWLYLLNSVSVGSNGALQWYLRRKAPQRTRRLDETAHEKTRREDRAGFWTAASACAEMTIARARYHMSMSPMPPMPPPPPMPAPPPLSSFGSSATIASVVSRRDATDAAFCRAKRVTLVGSTTPISTRSP